jgi:hypothetical protein
LYNFVKVLYNLVKVLYNLVKVLYNFVKVLYNLVKVLYNFVKLGKTFYNPRQHESFGHGRKTSVTVYRHTVYRHVGIHIALGRRQLGWEKTTYLTALPIPGAGLNDWSSK